MATDTLTPPAKPAAAAAPVDPERPTSKLIPAVLIVLLLAGIAWTTWVAYAYVTGRMIAGPNQEVKLIFLRLEQSVHPLGQLKADDPVSYRFLRWLAIGVPPILFIGGIAFMIWRFQRGGVTPWFITTLTVLGGFGSLYLLISAGFLFFNASVGKGAINPTLFWGIVLGFFGLGAVVYTVWMYIIDGKGVGWLWATFLGILRTTVYVVIALVFLLPALQTWDRTESYSRVLILLDLSGSMNVSDEVTPEGKPGRTRMDYVLDLLTNEDGKFFKGLQEHNPVFVYGFGGTTDLEPAEFSKSPKGKEAPRWSRSDWERFAQLDLRQWVLNGLSDEGREIVSQDERFKVKDQANQEQWATEFFKDNKALLEKLGEADKRRQAAAGTAKPADRKGTAPAPVVVSSDREKMEDKGRNLDQKLKARYAILNSTNVGDAMMNVFGQEERHMLAGMIVISDFRSTQSSDATFQAVREKSIATKTPVFTIGVGEERPKIEIRITDLQAPTKASPKDSFVVRVEMDGEGMVGKDGQAPKQPVFLDVFTVDGTGNPAKEPILTLQADLEFKSTGGPVPHGQVEFKFDPEDEKMLPIRKKAIGKDGKEEALKEFDTGDEKKGEHRREYKLVARTPKAKGEMFPGKEHVSDMPVNVAIVKQPLRILLVAGGPGKDYQFTRRLFMNERAKGLVELCVFLQVTDPRGSRAQDVPENQLLKTFPNKFKVGDKDEKPDDAFYNLAKYDVIICFDPDWTKIDPADVARLEKWVDLGGGLIFVAGINTHKLTEKTNSKELSPVINLLPIIVDDDRNFTELEKPTDKPMALNIPPKGAQLATYENYDFMKLDDAGKSPVAGWSEFFYGVPRDEWKPDMPVIHGFHRCYPCKKAKQNATVLATFPDTYVREDGKVEDQPYIATATSKQGRVAYLAGDLARLRQGKNGEAYHERFWTKLARYVGVGSQMQENRSRGLLVMGRQFSAKRDIVVEAKLRGIEFSEPLPKDARPIFRVMPAGGGAAKPAFTGKLTDKKGGTWDGWFTGRVRDLAPGKYTLELDVPDSPEVIRQDFYVKEYNPELDDTRPDKDRMFTTASPMSDLRLSDAGKKRQLETILNGIARADGTRDTEPHLYFDLNSAKSIPDYLSPRSESHSNKGRIDDLWSDGPDMDPNGKPPVIDKLLGAIQWVGLKMGISSSKPMTLPLALLMIVGLLSVEWLTRKLIKLA